MATNPTLEVAQKIRATIDQSPTETVQSVAIAVASKTGVQPRTFREHLKVGNLSMDEVFAAAHHLGLSAGDLLPREHRSSRTAA